MTLTTSKTIHADQAQGQLIMLSLDLGTKTGWAARLSDRTVTSGIAEFKNDRWQGGGMRFLCGDNQGENSASIKVRMRLWCADGRRA